MTKIFLRYLCGLLMAGLIAPAFSDETKDSLLSHLKADFKAKGPVTMERFLGPDEVQKICSRYPLRLTAQEEKLITSSQFNTVQYPADHQYIGDWKEGEKIAQNGRGLQSSDVVKGPNGGNCYACHQLSKDEIAFGNLGPSLYQYGKLRGAGEEVVKYTWAKIFNAQAFNACSNMPRFGHSGILTEQQIRDVMGLLFDPTSPVNQ
jgi:sulfur-oxidizing protein SoxX